MNEIDSDWLEYREQFDFSFRYPPGWKVVRHNATTTVAYGPNRDMFVLLQEYGLPPGLTPAQVITGGQFPAASFLRAPKIGQVEDKYPNCASAWLEIQLAGNSADGFLQPSTDVLIAGTWKALVTCESFPSAKLIITPGNFLTICGMAASVNPVEVLSLWKITRTYCGLLVPIRPALESVGTPGFYPQIPQPQSVPQTIPPPIPVAATQPPPVAPTPRGLSFERFSDPQMGTFIIDVPRGWRVRGGFVHAGLGDRRQWVETQSPEGISLMFGDPNFPQTFCHNAMVWGENFIPYPQGTTFLNIKASAKKLTEYYLKNAAPARIGAVTTGNGRDRKDLADAGVKRHPQLASFINQVYEQTIRVGDRTGRLIAFSTGNRGAMGFDNWVGNVLIWLAPAGLESIAEQAANRMIESYEITPRLNPIVMQDESMIAANGNIAVANQQQWFAGQQIAHNTQAQIGDILVNQYWAQQRTNDAIARSWEHNQNVIDGVMQRGSDAMRGEERLYDESMGREYYAPSGSNYYWVDSATGTVVGTTTDTPPDYGRDFRMLRRD